VAERKNSIGRCEACQQVFPYYLIHNGFNDSAYAYCDTCSRVALLGWYSPRPEGAPFEPFKRIKKSVEPYLRPCACGGHYTADAAPRCPKCLHPLSATEATSWIEANARGTAKGWRWQRDWEGLYAIVIDGKHIDDPWN
jgi:hypothetical protein